MTPLHYAVIWKDGLSIILEHVPVENFVVDLAWDIFRYALSVYRWSHQDTCSENCHCSECIMLFLDHSWYFAHCSSGILSHSSLTVQKKFLLYLKQSRQEIVGPTLPKLFGDDIGRRLNLMDLPTETVHLIIDHLQKTATTSPPSRRARIQAAVDSFNIYCEMNCAHTAEVAWQLGFHEVNYHAATYSPSLAYSALIGDRIRGEDYVLWLLDHGADPFQPLHDTEGHSLPTLAAHKAIHCITQPDWEWDEDFIDFDLNGLSQAAHEVARRLCSEPTTDSCLCACSANGCTPFLILLRNLDPTPFHSPGYTFAQPEDYVSEFLDISTMLYEDNGFPCQYEGQFREALRLFTFMTLGIRHTCCKVDGYHNDGDADEIREEDSELVDILETLMEQWHDVSFESADDFWLFFQGDWVIRLDEVFEDLRQIDQSEANRVRLQSLGVQLHAPIVGPNVPKPPVRRRRFVWYEESFWLDLLDTVAEGGDTSYFDRVLADAQERITEYMYGYANPRWDEGDEQSEEEQSEEEQ